MNTHDSYALASDWAKVCEAADVDTDATAKEVIEGFALDVVLLSNALMAVYDHGSQPNAHKEANEVIRLLAVRDDG